jgi:hypothetical protein
MRTGVRHGGYAQCSLDFAGRFVDVEPTYRSRTVRACAQFRFKPGQVCFQSLLELFLTLVVRAHCALFAADAEPSGKKHFGTVYLFYQTEPNTSFHPHPEGVQHAIGPYRAFHPGPWTLDFSCLFSPCGHCRRFDFAHYLLHAFTFLRPLALRALPRFLATMDALTFARSVLRLLIRQNERRPSNGQVSLVHMAQPSMHSVTKHLTRPIIAFVLPDQRDGLPGSFDFRGTLSRSRGLCQPEASLRYRSGLRLESAGSSLRAAESCSQSCYGLHVRLRLLSTPPRGDAVTFGYRKRVSLEGGLSPPGSRLLPGARIPAFA